MNRLKPLMLPSLKLVFFYAILILQPVQAQTLGNLFTTPEEREYLDLLREDFLARNAAANFDITSAEPPPLTLLTDEEEAAPDITEFHLSAIIGRTNGRRTIWLNGEALRENELPTNINLVNAGTAILIKSQDEEFVLKPGEQVNIETKIISNSSQVTEAVIPEVMTKEISSAISLPENTPQNPLVDLTEVIQPDLEDPAVLQAVRNLQEAMSNQSE